MPLAQLKGLSGFLSMEQKQELNRKVMEAIVSAEGEGVRPVTWVIVEDVPSGQWGVGGTPVTTGTLQQMAAQGQQRTINTQEGKHAISDSYQGYGPRSLA